MLSAQCSTTCKAPWAPNAPLPLFPAVFWGSLGVQKGSPAVSPSLGFPLLSTLGLTAPQVPVPALQPSEGWIEAALQPAGAGHRPGDPQACTVVQPERWMWVVSC